MRVLLMLLAVAAMAVIPVAAAQQAKSPAPGAKSARASKAAPAPTTPININTATQAQLGSLPGVGPKAAERILEYRKQNGHFKKIEEILETSRSCPCSLSICDFGVLRRVSRSRQKSQQISR